MWEQGTPAVYPLILYLTAGSTDCLRMRSGKVLREIVWPSMSPDFCLAVDCCIGKTVNICTCLAADHVDWYGCEYLHMYSFGSCGLVRLWDCFGLVWL
jgi:hypothetical protein